VNMALWYLGRGSGVTALVLFSLVVVLGIVTRAGQPLPGLPRFAVATLHRTVSLTAVLFLLLHISTLFVDPYSQLRLIDTVMPFGGAYRPLWQGLGTVAADLVFVLVASSLLRHHIGLRAWRVIHSMAYLCWPAALLHAVGIGTDTRSHWMLAVIGGCVASVAMAVAWRLTGGSFARGAPPRRLPPPPGLAGLQ
jgi:methionine sulfoxide reductase heme-binding subunit